ncbi:hypothetical protein AcV7_002018 [Taiwanofungus camphoratus]|nr:hypothetical protein AcV7_002018 [Antrodia cinnamomea]
MILLAAACKLRHTYKVRRDIQHSTAHSVPHLPSYRQDELCQASAAWGIDVDADAQPHQRRCSLRAYPAWSGSLMLVLSHSVRAARPHSLPVSSNVSFPSAPRPLPTMGERAGEGSQRRVLAYARRDIEHGIAGTYAAARESLRTGWPGGVSIFVFVLSDATPELFRCPVRLEGKGIRAWPVSSHARTDALGWTTSVDAA